MTARSGQTHTYTRLSATQGQRQCHSFLSLILQPCFCPTPPKSHTCYDFQVLGLETWPSTRGIQRNSMGDRILVRRWALGPGLKNTFRTDPSPGVSHSYGCLQCLCQETRRVGVSEGIQYIFNHPDPVFLMRYQNWKAQFQRARSMVIFLIHLETVASVPLDTPQIRPASTSPHVP